MCGATLLSRLLPVAEPKQSKAHPPYGSTYLLLSARNNRQVDPEALRCCRPVRARYVKCGQRDGFCSDARRLLSVLSQAQKSRAWATNGSQIADQPLTQRHRG